MDIECPKCGFWAIHLTSVDFIEMHYDCRPGAQLRFLCENGGHEVWMELINHEGQSVLRPAVGRRW